MSNPERILADLNKTLDKELKKNESLLERVGRYCANQRESFFSKKSSVTSAMLAVTSQFAGFGSIVAQTQGLIPDSQANNMIAIGLLALSGAILTTCASHHVLTKKIMDPILSHFNFNKSNPEKVAKVFNNIVSEKLYSRGDIPSSEKDCIFANLKEAFVEKVSIHYNGLNRFESFSKTEQYEKIMSAIKINNPEQPIKYQKRNHSSELGMG